MNIYIYMNMYLHVCINVYVHILHANEYKGTEAEKPVLPDTKSRGCSWR